METFSGLVVSTPLSFGAFVDSMHLYIYPTARTAEPEEDDIFFVFVLVYGTYKETKKENKKTKVFSSGYPPKEGWNT